MSPLRLVMTVCLMVPIALAQTPRRQIVQSFGKLPLGFEVNHGQTDSRVQYLSRGDGYTLFLTGSAAVLQLRSGVLRMRLTRANPKPDVVGLEELPGKSNSFMGKDPAQWRTNVPAAARSISQAL